MCTLFAFAMGPVRLCVWLLLWTVGVAVGKLPTLAFCVLINREE